MKKYLLMLCAIFAFGAATAQTENAKKKTEKAPEPAKATVKTEETKSVANDSTGLIDPTAVAPEGANSRDNSRQSQYNKPKNDSGK